MALDILSSVTDEPAPTSPHEGEGNPQVKLRTKEAAAFLSVKPNTLNHWVSARKIPHYKVSGRCVLFDMKDLEVFLASKKVEAVE